MPARRIGGRIYEEIAVRAVEPVPVSIQDAVLDLSGTTVEVGEVTVVNNSSEPVPISDAGGSITVDGPVTNAQLRASAVAVALSSVPLATGAATDTLQSTGNSTLATISGKIPASVSDRVPVDGSGVTQPVSDGGGSISVDDGGGSITVDGPLTDAQLRSTPVPVGDGGGSLTVDGSVSVTGVASTGVAARTPTTTSISGSSSSQLLIALNSNRKGLSVSNISTSKLYLSFSNPATVANCFMELGPGAFLLLDQQLIMTNAIYGIWTSSAGACQVTEYV